MSRTRRCFKTELPDLYRKSEYCGGVGCFIRYSEVRVQKYEERMGEEEAAVWLWFLAKRPNQPALPSWRSPIEWLFYCVTGRDLWGVDETGELVIVEDKMRDREDPFEGFLTLDRHDPEFTAERLKQKWDGLDTDHRLPRSSKSILAQRWARLTEATRERVTSKGYEERVDRFLKARKDRRSPPPHFVGLILSPNDQSRSLRHVEKRKELADQVGRDHVHLFLAYAKRVTELRAQCCVEHIADAERG